MAQRKERRETKKGWGQGKKEGEVTEDRKGGKCKVRHKRVGLEPPSPRASFPMVWWGSSVHS